MEERRRLPRWEVNKEAKVWLPKIQSSKKGMIQDMNQGGMRVSFDKQLPAEDPIEMSFVLSDHFTQFRTEAGVPWIKECYDKYIYGLSFNKISEEDKGKVYWYIHLL